jgi:predicted transcriptional regulator
MDEDIRNQGFEYILRIVFGISDLETKIITTLYSAQGNGMCINKMNRELDGNRSVVQRCLLKLYNMGLVTREQKTMEWYIKHCDEREREEYNFGDSVPKGYLFVYKAIPKDKLKKKLLEINQSSFNAIQEIIQEIKE